MAYQIFTSLDLESLVVEHRDALSAPLLGESPWIVLQNQSLAQWLKLKMARESGGYATPLLLFPDEALRRLFALAQTEPPHPLFVDELKWALFRALSEAAQSGDPRFSPLWGPHDRRDEVRRFELADALAGLFHTYAVNSPLICQALSATEPPPNIDVPTWHWQSALWKPLAHGKDKTLAGLLLERWTTRPPTLRQRPHVVLLGSTFLSRRALALFQAWGQAELIDVTHLLLVPSVRPESDWPDTRPWSSWGRFGRSFLATIAAPAPATNRVPQSTLHRLQDALAEGRRVADAVPDGSLEVLSCSHPWRELEVLRDRVLEALSRDPSLELHEIAVMAPDINVYAPFLDAVFSSDDSSRHLPYHLIDLDLGRENEGLQALDSLLTLLSGPVDRPRLFALIDSPVFRRAWTVGDSDRQLWLDYTEAVHAWREEPGVAGPQSWSSGEDALWTGWFQGPSERSPLSPPPSSYPVLGRLHGLLRRLQDAAHRVKGERPLAAWIRLLELVTGEILGSEDETVRLLLGRLHALDTLAEHDTLPLGWSGFRAFVQDQIAHFPGRRGQLLTEGLHCSSFRPLRAIPFRFIALLGLNEGSFPRTAPRWSFDLSRFDPSVDALSSVSLDRWTFWETLMAARDHLHLSYDGRSPVDGSARPSSSLLSDLMDLLQDGEAPWPVTIVPVKDFAVESQAVTGSPRTARRVDARKRARPLPWELSPTAEPVLSDVEVSTLSVREALITPARYFLRRVDRVSLRDEDHRMDDVEEPWSVSFAERHQWILHGLEQAWRGDPHRWDVDAWFSQAAARGEFLDGVFADRDREELQRRAREAQSWVAALAHDGWVLDDRPSPDRWAGWPLLSESIRLRKADAVLYPELSWTASISSRVLWGQAANVFADGFLPASAEFLSPDGHRHHYDWDPPVPTATLVAAAQKFWTEASRRPLGLYPDFWDALAQALPDTPREGDWSDAVDQAWWAALTRREHQSQQALARDPWAALAFPERPRDLVNDARVWWSALFSPLREAWVCR